MSVASKGKSCVSSASYFEAKRSASVASKEVRKSTESNKERKQALTREEGLMFRELLINERAYTFAKKLKPGHYFALSNELSRLLKNFEQFDQFICRKSD